MRRLHVDDLRGQMDFVIITIREDEFTTVLDRFEAPDYAQGERRYEIGEMETQDDQHYRYALVRCVFPGTGEAQSVAQAVIKDLDPKLLVLVGIGGAVPSSDFTLGDVVCATRVHDFCVSAIHEGRPETFNVGGGDMHIGIRNLLASLPKLARMLGDWNTAEVITRQCPVVTIPQAPEEKLGMLYGDEEWQRSVLDSLNRHFPNNRKARPPRCTAQAVASSDSLIKGTIPLKEWKEAARTLAVVEMELAGVYKAATAGDKVYPILAIRGISDVVGFKRHDDWTMFACEAAASFTAALIRSGELRDILGPKALAGGRGSARWELADMGVEFTHESLFTHIRSGNVNVVRLLLRAGLPPNVDLEGRTPLQEALGVIDRTLDVPFTEADHRIEVLRALITAGDPPRDLAAAAHNALSTKSRHRLTALLRAGVPLDIADHHGAPLISKAIAMDEDAWGASGDSPSWVELLVRDGAAMQGHWAARVMVWAGVLGPRSLIERLVARGYPVDGRVDGDTPTHVERPAELKAWWPGGTALHHATPRGADYLRPLLAAGADREAKDQMGRTPLDIALADPHPEAVQTLLEAGADPNLANLAGAEGRSMLANLFRRSGLFDAMLGRGLRIDSATATRSWGTALYYRNLKALRFLLDSGGAVEARDENGHTPLLYLCYSWWWGEWRPLPEEHEHRELWSEWSLECLDLLLRKGADPNAADKDGASSLHLLAEHGEAAAMRRLLEAGADIRATDRDGRTVLHVCKTPASAAVCIDAGLTGAVQDYRGYTPVDHAAMYGRPEVTEYLSQRDPGERLAPSAALVAACRRGDVAQVQRMLAEGIPVTTVDSYGYPLLHIAVRMHHSEMAEALVDSGADVNARDQNGATALYHALRWPSPSERRTRDDFVHLVTMLLDRGASPADIDGRGTSAAYRGMTATWFIPELAKRLIEISPRVSKRDGVTLTMRAAMWGSADLVRHTLSSGEDVNAADAEGKTALFYPEDNECEDVYRVLLLAGARVNVQDHSGNTALVHAVRRVLWPGIRLLLDHGADPTLSNNAGQTALHEAIRVGNLDLFRLLRDRGQLSQ